MLAIDFTKVCFKMQLNLIRIYKIYMSRFINKLASFTIILLILSLVNTEIIEIHQNQPTTDISIIQSNLDVSSYQILTLENGFKLLTIINPAFEGFTSYGLMVNSGGKQNPPEYPRLSYALSTYITCGSQKYPDPNQMNTFYAPNDVYLMGISGRSDIDLFATVPSGLSLDSISRVTDSFLNPIFTEEGLKSVISSELESLPVDQQGDPQALFLSYFGVSPLAKIYSLDAREQLLTVSHDVLNKSLVDHYNTFYSADIMAGYVAFGTYNQTIVDTILAEVKKIPNRQAKPILNTGSTLNPLNDDKLYIRFNSTQNLINLYIIPVQADGKTQQKDYEWIKLLHNLISNKNGFISQLKAQFPEIKAIKPTVKYQNQNKYPLIQIDIIFQNSSLSSGEDIYNYIKAYLQQDWTTFYSKSGLDLIKNLQYAFDKSPFADRPNFHWNWLVTFQTYLQNLLNFGNKHTLDGQYFVDPSILNAPALHKFKLAAVQFRELGDRHDGTDSLTGMTYQYVTPPNVTPQIKSASFVSNPYNIGIPATSQQFPKPQQNWLPYKSGSITFAPNYFLNNPFTPVTPIIHYNTNGINSAFPRIFFNALSTYLQSDIDYIYDHKIDFVEERNLFSFGLTGLKDAVFLFYSKLAATIPSNFYSNSSFTAALEATKGYYTNFYSTSSIERILDIDQALIEKPSLQPYEIKLNSLQDYDFSQFQKDHATFVKSLSWQWLVITFKQEISVFHQAIITLHYQYNIPYFSRDASQNQSTPNAEKISTFSHADLKLNAARIYYDFGSNNLKNFVNVLIFDSIVQSKIQTSQQISGGIHLSTQGKLGYKVDLSSKTENGTVLSQNYLRILNRQSASKIQITAFTQDIASKFNKTKFATLNDELNYVIPFIYAQCYECIASRSLEIDEAIKGVTSNSDQYDLSAFLSNYIQIIELPK